MNRQAFQFALREMRENFTSQRVLLVLGAVGVVLGLAGPFQTFEQLGLGARLTYWMVMVAATYGTGVFTSALVLGSDRPSFRNWWTGGIATGLAAGLGVSVVVLAINWLTFGQLDLDFFSIADTFLYCIAITSAVTMVTAYFQVHGHVSRAAQSGQVLLTKRLAQDKRGRLISMTVQDHYVAVTTTRGRSLVLIRFADALREADREPGLQIHRSHWVALDGIAEVQRSAGKTVIKTKAGDVLPVSRTYLPALKARGLLS